MGTAPVPVTVTIMDKDYRIACPPEEKQALLASAEFLNDRIKEIRDSGRVIGADRVAVMVALNLANDLLAQKSAHEGFSEFVGSRLHLLQDRIDQAMIDESDEEPSNN